MALFSETLKGFFRGFVEDTLALHLERGRRNVLKHELLHVTVKVEHRHCTELNFELPFNILIVSSNKLINVFSRHDVKFFGIIHTGTLNLPYFNFSSWTSAQNLTKPCVIRRMLYRCYTTLYCKNGVLTIMAQIG